MKKNRLFILSLLACTLLAGCNDKSFVQDGDNPIGTITDGKNTNDTIMNIQKFYETLKSNNGGSTVVDQLIKKIASIEYSDSNLASWPTSEKFDVRSYHTTASLQKEIAEKFEDVVDGSSYLDDDGNFDAKAYKDHVEETYDVTVSEGKTSDKYLTDSKLVDTLKYNYDEYIEKTVKPEIIQDYIYLDYVTSSSKYKGQFASQYAVKLEVLKVGYDSTKLNGSWNEAFIKDVKAVTGGAAASTETTYNFGTDYSFATFTSSDDMIVFVSAADKLTYSVYTLTEEAKNEIVPSHRTDISTLKQLDYYSTSTDYGKPKIESIINDSTKATLDTSKSWEITRNEEVNETYFKKVESLFIARKLWGIDREVVLAKNYDNRTAYYESMTETEKTEAKGFASTYSSSNTKSIADGAKATKITAEHEKYYTPVDYYTKSSYDSVLPSALSSLRGTSAKDLISHLKDFGGKNYLLPSKEVTDPVYLDVSSNNYYICAVPENGYYGYYKYTDLLDSSKPTKTISNYQIEAYQNGKFTEWNLDGSSYKEDKDNPVTYANNPERFEDIINLVQISAKNVITTAIKKEAIVALFEKYGLELNDQDIYDYVKDSYPDYFTEN